MQYVHRLIMTLWLLEHSKRMQKFLKIVLSTSFFWSSIDKTLNFTKKEDESFILHTTHLHEENIGFPSVFNEFLCFLKTHAERFLAHDMLSCSHQSRARTKMSNIHGSDVDHICSRACKTIESLESNPLLTGVFYFSIFLT